MLHPTQELEPPANPGRFKIERLRSRNWHAPIKGGHVFFNQDEAIWILKCEDFRFDFFQIDRQASPYLAASIEHELLNMHAEPQTVNQLKCS